MSCFPCLVIKSIYDYPDSHKNKTWQGDAAMNEAGYAVDLLGRIALNRVEAERRAVETLGLGQQRFTKRLDGAIDRDQVEQGLREIRATLVDD